MLRKILVLLLFFYPSAGYSDEFTFGVTREFCNLHFNGKIAAKGEPFNATDVVEDELPSRRIVAEFVTSTVAYIWYEHGGRGFHQHLVQYNILDPSEIIENYTFFKTSHSDIFELIETKATLKIQSHEEL